MTKSSVGEPKRSSLFWRLYTLTWVGLAGVAVGYLSVVLTNPELVAKLSDGATVGSSDHSESLKAQKQVTAELQTLRETVSSLRNDLARVETKVASAADSNAAKAQAQNVAQAPANQQVAGSAIPALVPLNAKEEAPKLPTQSVKTTSIRVGKLPPLPVRGPARPAQFAAKQISTGAGPAVVINSGRLVTGSVPKTSVPAAVPRSPAAPNIPTPSFQTPSVSFELPGAAGVPTSATGPATAVVVSAATSLAGLRASWDQLSRNHPALLGTLEPRYDAMGNDGGPYRLLAGPLSDRVEADRLCSELRANGVACGVGEFVGKAL